ncbi:unnamed protein product [Tetraodon nigroviridis]|uniref:(spotted green pufferfish) hypothetical protein n=1 Tax=Tetraodon nigroviridis TaxID=99883 RepID=Q4RX65_TETNG|nr:unnamed protein product [Tetraodon nigroviridis]
MAEPAAVGASGLCWDVPFATLGLLWAFVYASHTQGQRLDAQGWGLDSCPRTQQRNNVRAQLKQRANTRMTHSAGSGISCDAPVRHRQKTVVTDMCYPTQISSLMDFGTPDCSLGKAIRWSQSSTRSPVAQAAFPSPLHQFMHSEWVGSDLKPRRVLWDERLQADSGACRSCRPGGHEVREGGKGKKWPAVCWTLWQEKALVKWPCQKLPDSCVLLHEEVVQLQEEVQLLRQMKDMLSKDLQESQGGCSADLLSATELRVQLGDKEQELDRAKEALQAMKADRKRLKVEKADLASQMQQLYTTLESREEQLREFIRNYDQHRKESEDAVKALAKEKDLLEREKWDLRRQTKEAAEQVNILRAQMDMKENRVKELEAELTMAKQSLATLTKDVPKRHSLAMPTEPVVNGSQEWVMQADLPLTAAIRQSQQTLYHGHTADRQAVVRISPCHSRQPSVISDASAADGDRSSTPSDINSPRHRTHSLCNSMEDLEDQKRKKKKEKMTLGSLSRVFTRGKQRKSLDPGLFDGTAAPDYYIEEDADW